MDSQQLAPYALALLQLMEEQSKSTGNPPLGDAKRIGVENSMFTVQAHLLLRALIEYSPSPDVIAAEFLVELVKCGNPAVKNLTQAVQSNIYIGKPDDWAATVHRQILESDRDLASVTNLASHYFSHLLIAFKNPGGKKTPQDTAHSTPNLRRIEEIQGLLDKATIRRSQSALKDLILLRDGTRCLLTAASFTPPLPITPRCAHLIPFSVHSKTQTHSTIEAFTGRVLDTAFIQGFINHPKNALNMETNAHDSMDKYLAWGIEAMFTEPKWRYYYRVVRKDFISPFINLKDGDEIRFGLGPGGDTIALPDPRICNLHLALARVSFASGASEVFDKFIDDDDDDQCDVPIYFGGPFVPDDVLMRRLEALAC